VRLFWQLLRPDGHVPTGRGRGQTPDVA